MCRISLTVLLLLSLLSAQDKITLAVMDFDASGISHSEALILTDRLRNELFRTGKFTVVERGIMEKILNEWNLYESGCTSDECLIQIGKMLGAQQIVGGRIGKFGAVFTISARLISIETGEVLRVSDYDLQGPFELLLTKGMNDVASDLAGAKDEPKMGSQGVVQSVAVFTGTWDFTHEYTTSLKVPEKWVQIRIWVDGNHLNGVVEKFHKGGWSEFFITGITHDEDYPESITIHLMDEDPADLAVNDQGGRMQINLTYDHSSDRLVGTVSGHSYPRPYQVSAVCIN